MPYLSPTLMQRLQEHWFYPAKASLKQYERLLLGALEGLYRLVLTLKDSGFRLKQPGRVNGVSTLAVGNLIVGGAGKTPTVMGLAAWLTKSGRQIGILSRGYKSQAEHGLCRVLTPNQLNEITADEVGDEAWLMCWRTGLPVAIGKNRLASLETLKSKFPSLDLVILDDGLSQRTLISDRTLLVMDARGFGNRHCLPLGPLREPAINLTRFDGWVDNGFSEAGLREPLPEHRLQLTQHDTLWVNVDRWQSPEHWLSLDEGIAQFRQSKILAVAGIAVPERFFESLRRFGLSFEAMPLADHDPQLVARVLSKCDQSHYDVILMTEKDAVKFFHHPCAAREKIWALRRQASLEPSAIERLIHGL